MAEVRSTEQTPSLAAFREAFGTPIVVDRLIGGFYALLKDQTIIDLRTGARIGYGAEDDLKFPVTRERLGALSKPDFDYTNIGLLFPQNDPTEILYMIGQLPHTSAEHPRSYLAESDLYPHVHFDQTSSAVPVFKLAYKWYNNGEAIPAGFTTITTSSLLFPYTSGTLAQKAIFPAISGAGKKVSSILKMKLWREDNVVAGDVLVTEFDIHYRSFCLGTVD